MPLDWDRLTPAMRAALRNPRNKRPLRFSEDTGDVAFEVNEREHVDRKQAKDLRRRLTDVPNRGTISGSYDLRAIDEEDRDA